MGLVSRRGMVFLTAVKGMTFQQACVFLHIIRCCEHKSKSKVNMLVLLTCF